MKIAFIGGGVMAEAIIEGILRGRVAQPGDIFVGEPIEARRQQLAQRYGIATTQANLEACQRGDLVILSVKPQNLPDVLAELRGSLRREQTVVSIVAGARMETITSGLRHDKLIRVMPNTPAQIGAGMSLWLASPSVSQEIREAVRAILSTLGEELAVAEEKYLDMATALSASGPAYVFLFIESLIDAGVYMGMSRDMARKLAVQTVLGSARFVQTSGKPPAELRDMVTSPGGTTAEALKVLEEGRFRATVINAVAAAYEKAKSLGGQK
ncbi:MAG: pyrroline-5-carboxylate reductase [Dehalococcoidia bacterium]|nr:pyrroline-5-carboxylate reductase [Dehalococcoidia bacterium]